MAEVDSKKLMVLGSMDEFIELVDKAHDRGISVVVCDGYADGPAKARADVCYTVDIHDTEAIAAICRAEGVDGIITAYSDVLAECAAQIAHAAGLEFYLKPESLAYLRDKTLMKSMFDKLGVPYPHSAVAHRDSIVSDLAGLSFPVVTKPLDAWGSHGVYLLDSPDRVAALFDDIASYSDADAILVEEYNDGFEFNMMTWIVDGSPRVLEIADREKSFEIPEATPHVSRIVYPSVLTDAVLDAARDIVARVAAYVGLDCGPLCMQFFWKPGEGIQVCECAGRIFGYEHELLELASDGVLSIEDLLLDYVFDRDALRSRLADHDPHLARVAAGLYFHGYEGLIGSIEGAPVEGEPREVSQVIRYYENGDEISHAVGAKPYVLRAYIVSDDRARVDELTDGIYAQMCVSRSDGTSMLYHSERTKYDI